MAQEEGMRVTGRIVPSDASDTYATHEDTLGKGGLRICANQAAMLVIPYERRKLGMEVKYFDVTWKKYELINNPVGDVTEISDWQESSSVIDQTDFQIYIEDDTEYILSLENFTLSTIASVSLMTDAGTVDVTLKNNDVNVGGIIQLSVSNTKSTTSPTSNDSFEIGNSLKIFIENISSSEILYGSIKLL